MKRLLFFTLMIIISNLFCKDTTTKYFYASVSNANFYNLDIDDFLNSNFVNISKILSNNIHTDDHGHIWISGNIQSSNYNIVFNNYLPNTSFNNYKPEEIDFFEYFEKNNLDGLFKYLKYHNNIILNSDDLYKLYILLPKLANNEQVTILFNFIDKKCKIGNSGLSIRPIVDSGINKYFCCIYFYKI